MSVYQRVIGWILTFLGFLGSAMSSLPAQPTTQGKSLPSRTRIILAARTGKMEDLWRYGRGFSYRMEGPLKPYGLKFKIMEHVLLFLGSPILGRHGKAIESVQYSPNRGTRETNIEDLFKASKSDVYRHMNCFCRINYYVHLKRCCNQTLSPHQHLERWCVNKSLRTEQVRIGPLETQEFPWNGTSCSPIEWLCMLCDVAPQILFGSTSKKPWRCW